MMEAHNFIANLGLLTHELYVMSFAAFLFFKYFGC